MRLGDRSSALRKFSSNNSAAQGRAILSVHQKSRARDRSRHQCIGEPKTHASQAFIIPLACLCLITLAGCSSGAKEAPKKPAAVQYFHPDPATAGVLKGVVHYAGKKPTRKVVDMSSDPACEATHKSKVFNDTIIVNPDGTLANVFVYIRSGLEGKQFEVPQTPVAFDQRGCWFISRVVGVQTGQIIHITNSDPVNHNLHALAQTNREWNHSQPPEEGPIDRKFLKPEVMIPVKCNIHGWMHAYIGVVDHPYFAVTGADGSFELRNVPPGDYVIEAWQEQMGKIEQKVTLPPSGNIDVGFTFKGE